MHSKEVIMAFSFTEYYFAKYTMACDKLASNTGCLLYLLSENRATNTLLPEFKKDFTLYCQDKGINIDFDAFILTILPVQQKKETLYLSASAWLENKKHTLFSHYEYMQLSKLFNKEGIKRFHERMKSYFFVSRPEMLSLHFIDFIFEHTLNEYYIKSQHVQNWETVLYQLLNNGKYREAEMLWKKTGHTFEELFFIKALLSMHDKNIAAFLWAVDRVNQQSLREFIKTTIYNITYDAIYDLKMKQWSCMPYHSMITYKQRQDEIKRIQQRIANIQTTMQKKEINITLSFSEPVKLKRL